MSKNPKRKKRKRIRVMAALIIVCAAILLDSRFRIVTEEYIISDEKIPAGFDGFRIVQLSDLHGMEFGQDNKRLLKAVSDASPDIIVLTGDFLDSIGYLPEMADLCGYLKAIAPTYFVSGNHDWASGRIRSLADVLSDSGVDYLQNEYVTLQSGGDSVVLCGVEDPNGYSDMPKPDELVDIIRNDRPDEYIILLGHRNYWIDNYPDLNVDIIFCGHGHGGIVRLPGIGGLIGTNLNLFPEYTAGVYESTNYKMLVSRGLGNVASIPRILNNPQIVAVTLRSKQS